METAASMPPPFERTPRMGAVRAYPARRMVGLMWVLAKRRQLYADVPAGELARKFRYHK
jgi:hypothetical protein